MFSLKNVYNMFYNEKTHYILLETFLLLVSSRMIQFTKYYSKAICWHIKYDYSNNHIQTLNSMNIAIIVYIKP